MGSESMLQEILWDTKIGWWKVDMARRVLLLSDYLCKTIGTEESEIGYDRFLQSVGEPFRASLKSLMSTDASLFSAEQIFRCVVPGVRCGSTGRSCAGKRQPTRGWLFRDMPRKSAKGRLCRSIFARSSG